MLPGHICGVSGCHRPKTTKAKYCAFHNGRMARNGHPTASAIPNAQLLPYMVRVGRLLRPQRDTHEGLKLACGELDGLLKECMTATREGQPQRPYERHLTRLALEGVEGINILEAATAVLLFDAENPNRIRGQRALHFAVARLVCSLIPRQGMPVGAKVAEPLAELLMTRYIGLFWSAMDYFNAEAEREQRRARLLSAPLQPGASRTGEPNDATKLPDGERN